MIDWLSLPRNDQRTALNEASASSGIMPHLLEKDIWVVWCLSVLYSSSLANMITFKGGTSLSKVYRLIDRFSEDIDLTVNIKEFVPDLLKDGSEFPETSSQQKKLSDAIRKKLPGWIQNNVQPLIDAALVNHGLQNIASTQIVGDDQLLLAFTPMFAGNGYAQMAVKLEFGAKATGEPNDFHEVNCDAAPFLGEVRFPVAQPLVMRAERTLWEKATAIHVFCKQGRLRGERFSRHWYDISMIAKSDVFNRSLDQSVAEMVARHKSIFFKEKDAENNVIDYFHAVRGNIVLVPEGQAYKVLAADFDDMLAAGFVRGDLPKFSNIIETCRAIQDRLNALR